MSVNLREEIIKLLLSTSESPATVAAACRISERYVRKYKKGQVVSGGSDVNIRLYEHLSGNRLIVSRNNGDAG